MPNAPKKQPLINVGQLRQLCGQVSQELDKARLAFGFANTKPQNAAEQMLNIKQAFEAFRNVINSPQVKQIQQLYTTAKNAGQKVMTPVDTRNIIASQDVSLTESVDVTGLMKRSILCEG